MASVTKLQPSSVESVAREAARRDHKREAARTGAGYEPFALTRYERAYLEEKRVLRWQHNTRLYKDVVISLTSISFAREKVFSTVGKIFSLTSRCLRRPLTASAVILLTACLAHASIPQLTNFAVAELVRGLVDSDGSDEIAKRLDCATLSPITNQYPSSGEAVLLGYITHPDRVADCHSDKPQLRSTVVSSATAEAFTKVLSAVEGNVDIGPKTIVGFDLAGILRSIFYKGKGRTVGGSNPIQSSVKAVLDRPGSLSYFMKLVMMGKSISYTAHHLPTDADRHQFIARSALCARGQPQGESRFGAPVAGGLCAPLLFNKSADQLVLAELILWAAAYKQQFRVVGYGAPKVATQAAILANRKTVGRALYIAGSLHSMGRLSDSELRELASEIKVLGDKVIQRLTGGGAVNPSHLLDLRAPGMKRLLLDEIKLRSGTLTPAITPLQLSLNLPLQTEIERAVSEILPISAKSIQPDILITVIETTDGQERLIAAHSNRHGLWHGPISKPIRFNGQRDRLSPQRSMGSIIKALFLPALLREGIFFSCRANHDVQDHDGYEGALCENSASTGWVSIESTLAHSWNTSYADAILQLPRAVIEGVAMRFGLNFDPSLKTAELAVGAALGTTINVSPERAATVFHLYATVAAESEKLVLISEPTLIERRMDELPVMSLMSDGDSQSNLLNVVDVLAHPVTDPEGTLASVYESVPSLRLCTVMGKTGTSEISGGGVARDRYAILSVICGTRAFTVSTMVGSTRIDRRLISQPDPHLKLINRVVSHLLDDERNL